MPLSELCRLPVSNHKLSAHISVPWTEKKKKNRKDNKALPAGLEVDRPKLCFSFTVRGWKKLEENWGRVGALSCGLQRPSYCQAGLRVLKRTPLQQKAAALAFAKSAWQLTFTSAFFATYMWQEGAHIGLRLKHSFIERVFLIKKNDFLLKPSDRIWRLEFPLNIYWNYLNSLSFRSVQVKL